MKAVGDGGKSSRRRAGWRICIAGTGGQGVMTAARLLCEAFVRRGHDVVSGQLHGMAQRGGSVQSSVMIDSGISPMMGSGQADLVLGLEPVETVRALRFMAPHTVVLMNAAPVIPYTLGQQTVLRKTEAHYPDIADLERAIRAVTERLCVFDATELAVRTGAPQALNVLMLGCLLGTGMLPVAADEFWRFVSDRLPSTLAQANARAYNDGVVMGRKFDVAGNRV